MSVPASSPETAGVQSSPLLDRRLDDRLRVCVPVRVMYVSGKRVSYNGTCTNVSTSGAAIELEGVLQAGDVIEFEFRNTDDMPIVHRARIMYRNGSHYGLYFLNVY